LTNRLVGKVVQEGCAYEVKTAKSASNALVYRSIFVEKLKLNIRAEIRL